MKSQQLPSSCNQSTTAINTIFYPNTTTNILTAPSNYSGMYLCGPNTIVYDTSNINNTADCRSALVCANSTLVTNASICTNAHVYFIKNNGTFNYTGYVNNMVQIFYEPGAIIIFNNNIANTYTCSALSFPTINCTPTTILENFQNKDAIKVYPNPANDILNINLNLDSEKEFTKIQILSNLGQIIREEAILFKNKNASIKTNDLPNGVYLLLLRADPIVIGSSSLNQFTISKRFVITR